MTGDLPAAPAVRIRTAISSYERFFNDPRRRRSPPAANNLERAPALLAAPQASAMPPSMRICCSAPSTPMRKAAQPQQCATWRPSPCRHRSAGGLAPGSQGYRLHRARFRQLPSDAQILEAVLQIPTRAGVWPTLMATYGLRNHEVFFCDLSCLADRGDRVIRCCPPPGEHQVALPAGLGGSFWLSPLDSGGTRCRRCKPTSAPSNRWADGSANNSAVTGCRSRPTTCAMRAVRTIHIGLPDTVAARMMGHSVAIHTRTYHHWITRRDQQLAVDAALARLHS